MDTVEQARLGFERKQRADERLRQRLEERIRELVAATALVRSHPELGEIRPSFAVVSQYVIANVCLDPAQLKILPLNGRTRDLEAFTEELRAGLEKLSADIRLPLSRAPSAFPISTPICVLPPDVHGGYSAVFLRPKRE
ncbi:MAG: hypothetical protein WB947_00585 [Thermoplasmata archaeon]